MDFDTCFLPRCFARGMVENVAPFCSFLRWIMQLIKISETSLSPLISFYSYSKVLEILS